MSSSKVKTMPVRIDEDVYKWITALRDALGSDNISEAIRHAFLRAYPNIEDLAEAAESTSEERKQELAKLLVEMGGD